MPPSDPRFAGVLPPSASSLKPGNAAIAPGGLQLPGGAASPTGLPQLSGEGAAPGGAAGSPEGLQVIVQQLAQAILQATGKPPSPQQLQAALMSLVGGQGAPGGGIPGGGAAGPAPAPMGA